MMFLWSYFAPAAMVATSSLTVVEAASAFTLAVRMGRLTEREGRRLLDTLNHDLGPDGVIGCSRSMSSARWLAPGSCSLRHPLRTLGALQLAIAEHEGQQLAAGEALVFAMRDQANETRRSSRLPLG
jgi:hypothetical protein